jgi:hypothetical protein
LEGLSLSRNAVACYLIQRTTCPPSREGEAYRSMQFCDLKCIHASAPREEMDGSRSCMTFTALWCELLGRHVMKSQPCSEKKERSFRKEMPEKSLD